MEALAVIALAGVSAGILSGLMGVGGGMVLVPMMVFLMGIPQHAAQGISLVVIIPTALTGLWHFHHQGIVKYKVAALLALGAVVGALASSDLVQTIPPETLRRFFGVFVICMGLRMALNKKK